jgi:hypothetical protein
MCLNIELNATLLFCLGHVQIQLHSRVGILKPFEVCLSGKRVARSGILLLESS